MFFCMLNKNITDREHRFKQTEPNRARKQVVPKPNHARKQVAPKPNRARKQVAPKPNRARKQAEFLTAPKKQAKFWLSGFLYRP